MKVFSALIVFSIMLCAACLAQSTPTIITGTLEAYEAKAVPAGARTAQTTWELMPVPNVRVYAFTDGGRSRQRVTGTGVFVYGTSIPAT